ncbi:MAG: aminotransferase class I/II-fold pyridoxal phosphate-dependent enzyme [Spirochaetia bacterium]
MHEEHETAATTHRDIFEKCGTDGGVFGIMRIRDDHYFTRPILPPKADRIMEFEGQDKVMWSINNYLGLADSEEIKQSAIEAVREFGVSSPMGSRMMSGNTPYHQELESRLADFAQKEAAFLFNYGYLGVLGTIQSIVGQDDMIIMDKLAHASIVCFDLFNLLPAAVDARAVTPRLPLRAGTGSLGSEDLVRGNGRSHRHCHFLSLPP